MEAKPMAPTAENAPSEDADTTMKQEGDGDGDPSSQYLDLTSFQLHDLSDVEIPEGLVDLDLTANRLSSIDPRITSLSQLRKLSLRQNLFNDLSLEPLSLSHPLSSLQMAWSKHGARIYAGHAVIVELILRDNKLTRVPDVSIFRNLSVFDVSFNEIPSLSGLSTASSTIKELYVSKNEVNKVMELEHLHALQILELGSNKLRALTKLEDLWLNDNQITSLEGLEVAVAGSRETLTTIYLENNPCAKSSDYTSVLRQKFPNLQQLDSDVF